MRKNLLLMGSFGIIGVAGLLFNFNTFEKSKADAATLSLTCANGSGLNMKGWKRYGNNAYVMRGTRRVPGDFLITRALCTNPSGRWTRHPMAQSRYWRSCGGIFNNQGRPVYHRGVRVVLCYRLDQTTPPPARPRRQAQFIIDHHTGACRITQRASYMLGQGSFNIRIMRKITQTGTCAAPVSTSYETVSVPADFGCVYELTDHLRCETKTEIICMSPGSVGNKSSCLDAD
jgi:hypothetical protein